MKAALAKRGVSGVEPRFSSVSTQEHKTYILTAVSGAFLVFSWFGWFKEQLGFDPAWVSIFISGTPILKGAITGLLTRRDIKAGLLVSIALIAAVAIGEYFAAGEVAFIMDPAIFQALPGFGVLASHRGWRSWWAIAN